MSYRPPQDLQRNCTRGAQIRSGPKGNLSGQYGRTLVDKCGAPFRDLCVRRRLDEARLAVRKPQFSKAGADIKPLAVKLLVLLAMILLAPRPNRM